MALSAVACDPPAEELDAPGPEMDGDDGEPVTPGEPPEPRDSGMSAMTDAGARACGPAGECDLLSLGDCGEGESCVLAYGAALGSLEDGGSELADEDAGASGEQGDGAIAPMCVPAGSGRDGDACDGLGECGPGLDCSAREGGTCRRHCCELNTTAGCPSGQFCRVELRDAAGEATGAALCDACDGCDPLAADCPDGQACYPLAAGEGTCLTCLPAGTRSAGDACEHSNDCALGAACVALAGERRCARLCALTGGGDCDGRATCTAVAGEPFGASVGLCPPSAER